VIACFCVPRIGLAVEWGRRPELTGKPLALTRDGLLCAVSHEAECFGIKPGQKASGAYSLCANLIVAPYLLDTYEAAIRPLWNLCAIESSIVEPVSPEICFVELSGRDQELRARLLLTEIDNRIPTTVFCGFACTKFVAQEAARAASKGEDRIQISAQARSSHPHLTSPAPARSSLREPWGEERDERFLRVAPGAETGFLDAVMIPASLLDRKTADRLERLGIRTLGDIRRLPPGELERQAKQYAARLRRLAVGQDAEAVRAVWPPRRIDQDFDFDEEITNTARIEQALLRCSIRIVRKLDRDYAHTVQLVAHRPDRSKSTASERLAAPINASADLYLISLRLLKRLALACPITLVRLTVRDISIASGNQLRLLDDNEQMAGLPHERQAALETTRGFLNARYGKMAMNMASAFTQPQQIDLTLAPLGRRLNEPIEVSIENGAPICFSHHNRRYPITGVLDRWKCIECNGDSVSERSSYRVTYGRCAIADLERSKTGWRLVCVGD
jgi:DNA polymerase-4